MTQSFLFAFSEYGRLNSYAFGRLTVVEVSVVDALEVSQQRETI